MKTITITLRKKELKLLMLILKECEETRSDMCCKVPDKKEEKLFTKKERLEISKTLFGDEDAEKLDGFLYNNQYVQHIINVIKPQTRDVKHF